MENIYINKQKIDSIQSKKKNKNKNKNKIKNKIKNKNKNNNNNNNLKNNDLLMLLNEAKSITLNDLDFDNILKEQGQILCNINDILNKENKILNEKDDKKDDKIDDKKDDKKDDLGVKTCNINNLNTDLKFKNILSKYKLTSKKHKNQSKLSSKKTKINYYYPSKNIQKQLSKKKTKTRHQIKQKNINIKQIPNYIRKLTKKKYLYKHNNKRKYDISISNPNIYIKNIKDM